ncbi:MAG: diadenylate cyclase CdaA [Alloprevotella sp.]|jgi:TIGR00159 family protein|uniref:diadenylate cyclase CdaA n=1 Tax=Alloprevotella sp. Lung230 TaxID=2766595 RepID=UPI000F14978E|nr:diadenylate cyclase CdaA [Alloprevotella sp. Lung230]MBC8625473.1 TIGR00159 family protein [Alloprevotella sp. Lung230]RKV70575.1 MAG: TIGR00159 family protein [Alloprevotella sp.]
MIEVGIKDIIDIVLVALLLFYIYKLMRESSSANIFGGVLIFVLVWIFVSKVFEMRLLGGIFDTLINVGSLALIILFQEEIRQFFSSIGTQRASRVFHWLHRHREGNIHREDIMPIVMACMSMGKQKIGALIVVERDMNLNDISKTGEIIDATISQRLIENIFFKNSPLHDGAMVVSKKRIKAAGCILPVSHDNAIPKSLGLRHRAALGISQKCDCMAIIVSEETGGISIAQNGQFALKLSAEQLESRLTALMERMD